MDIQNRISHLEMLIAEDPSDPFLHYAYCLEISKTGRSDSEKNWDLLLDKSPEYLPAYYQSGLYCLSIQKKDKAIQIWKKGIDLAIVQNDGHALTELKGILQNTLLDDED
jgi:hypothetical protein